MIAVSGDRAVTHAGHGVLRRRGVGKPDADEVLGQWRVFDSDSAHVQSNRSRGRLENQRTLVTHVARGRHPQQGARRADIHELSEEGCEARFNLGGGHAGGSCHMAGRTHGECHARPDVTAQAMSGNEPTLSKAGRSDDAQRTSSDHALVVDNTEKLERDRRDRRLNNVMYVSEIWRYPVKSISGERLMRIKLELTGVEGDRMVHVEDQRGHVISARTHPQLLAHHAVSGTD